MHAVGERQQLTILDMGCGIGQLLRELKTEFKDRDLNLTGVDYSEGMIQEAQKENDSIEFVHSDVLDFHRPDKHDVVIVTHSLPYYPDQRRAVQHLASLLKGEGHLLIANASATTCYDKLVLGLVQLTTGRANYPSKRSMEALMQEHFSDMTLTQVDTAWFVPTILLIHARKSVV